MTSALYHCRVTHRRKSGPAHRLSYRVTYCLLDIDELPILDHRLRLFGVDRSRLFSVRRRDHGHRDETPLRRWAEDRLDQAGLAEFGARLYLLCLPRMLGYAFNPLSVWYCADADGRIGAIIYEVHNTFGGRHAYVIPVEVSGGQERFAPHHADKEFYVSPFIGMVARYEFRLSAPADRIAVTIRETGPDGANLMVATLSGKRADLNDRALLGMFLRQPLMTRKVALGIHWEALKLWIKGAPFRSRKRLSLRERAGRFGGHDHDTRNF